MKYQKATLSESSQLLGRVLPAHKALLYDLIQVSRETETVTWGQLLFLRLGQWLYSRTGLETSQQILILNHFKDLVIEAGDRLEPAIEEYDGTDNRVAPELLGILDGRLAAFCATQSNVPPKAIVDLTDGSAVKYLPYMPLEVLTVDLAAILLRATQELRELRTKNDQHNIHAKVRSADAAAYATSGPGDVRDDFGSHLTG